MLAEVAAGKPVLTRLLQAGDADPIEIGRRRALGGENVSSNPSPPAPTSPERSAESK